MDEEYIVNSYDMVVHLVTAADGAEKFYKFGYTTDDHGNSVYRSEPPERARALDGALRDVWSNHPRHVIVGNTDGGMKAKTQKVIEESWLSVSTIILKPESGIQRSFDPVHAI